jgi:exonuclease SbcC
MIVQTLEVKNFRKFENNTFDFKSGVNLVAGLNGSGKSTLLNAIAYAIYGEPVLGTNLRDNLHYGANGRSNLASVNLVLSNSEKITILRSISLTDNIAKQTTTLNGRAITASDLSKMEKTLPNRELFYELLYIDNMRQDLEDLNQQKFRQTLSVYRLNWDRQVVEDNIKSFSAYMKAKQTSLKENISKSNESIEKFSVSFRSLLELEKEQSALSADLEARQRSLAKLEDDKVNEEVRERNRLKSLAVMEREIEEFREFTQRIGERLSDFDKLEYLTDNNCPNDYFKEYKAKTNMLLDDIQALRNVVEKIIARQQDTLALRAKKRMVLSKRLDEERNNIAMNISKLEQISHELSLQTTYQEEQRKIKSLVESYTNDLQNYTKKSVIADYFRELIEAAMDSTILVSLQRIIDHVNGYLQDIDVKISVKIINNEIGVQLKESDVMTDLDILSAGERSLLNLLMRIATLQELGQNSLLLLEDPIVCFDEIRIKEFLRLLKRLKNDFSQIIIATTRKDVYLSNSEIVDKLIELD